MRWLTLALGLVFSVTALAEEGAPSNSNPAAQPTAAAPSEPVVKNAPAATPTKKKRGTPTRDKETEGTEARDRFQADTGIKSQYKLNGESLEVDPD